jgi:hypothetical protein
MFIYTNILRTYALQKEIYADYGGCPAGAKKARLFYSLSFLFTKKIIIKG